MIRAVVFAALIATPAAAQSVQCAPTPAFIAALMSTYGERIVDEEQLPSAADPSAIITLQVWANEQTGTWTFTGATVQVMCMMASGRGYSGQTVRYLLKIDQPV